MDKGGVTFCLLLAATAGFALLLLATPFLLVGGLVWFLDQLKSPAAPALDSNATVVLCVFFACLTICQIVNCLRSK